MWDQYRKNFVGMQTLIAMVTYGAFASANGRWAPAALVFATMQVGMVLGAAWGTRLRRRWRRQPC